MNHESQSKPTPEASTLLTSMPNAEGMPGKIPVGSELIEEEKEEKEEVPNEKEAKDESAVEIEAQARRASFVMENQKDMAVLPDIDFEKTGLPMVDDVFALVEEVLDTCAEVNKKVIQMVKDFLVFFQERAGGALVAKIRELVVAFVLAAKEGLKDITACMPELDLGGIAEGKISVRWPEMDFSKLDGEAREKAEQDWQAIMKLVNGIVDLARSSCSKIPDLMAKAKEQVKNFGIIELASQANGAFSSMSEAGAAKDKAVRNVKVFKTMDIYISTFSSNLGGPMLAVVGGFNDALEILQQEAFEGTPEPKTQCSCFRSGGMPDFDAVKVDPNDPIKLLPRLGVKELGIQEIDKIFTALGDVLDSIVSMNNDVVKSATNCPGMENSKGKGLKDSLSKLTYDIQAGLKGEKFCCCGGSAGKGRGELEKIEKGPDRFGSSED